MISRILRVLLVILASVVAVLTITNIGNYHSLIPEEFNLKQILKPKESAVVEPVVQPTDQQPQPIDSLAIESIDSLSNN